MDREDETLEAVTGSLNDLLRQVVGGGPPLLARRQEVEEARAARLSGAADRLRERVGAGDPRVVTLGRAAAAAAALAGALGATATRVGRRHRAEPHEWVVSGQVRDAAGESIAGARVRVFDRDRRYDDLLGVTTTDEYGDFAVVYHERDFAEVGEGLPELYVLVEDAQGQLLFSSRDSIRYAPSRAEYLDVVIGEPPTAAAPKKPARSGRGGRGRTQAHGQRPQ